jgi:hypothetical protein
MVTHKSLSNLAPVVPLPYAPENKFLSKAEFVEKNRKRKEIEAKAKAYADDLTRQADAEVVYRHTPEPEPPIKAEPGLLDEVKKPGRPSKKYKAA